MEIIRGHIKLRFPIQRTKLFVIVLGGHTVLFSSPVHSCIWRLHSLAVAIRQPHINPCSDKLYYRWKKGNNHQQTAHTSRLVEFMTAQIIWFWTPACLPACIYLLQILIHCGCCTFLKTSTAITTLSIFHNGNTEGEMSELIRSSLGSEPIRR